MLGLPFARGAAAGIVGAGKVLLGSNQFHSSSPLAHTDQGSAGDRADIAWERPQQVWLRSP